MIILPVWFVENRSVEKKKIDNSHSTTGNWYSKNRILIPLLAEDGN